MRVVGPLLRDVKARATLVLERASAFIPLSNRNTSEGCVVLLTLSGPASTHRPPHHAGVHTDAGRMVVFQCNYDDERGRIHTLDLTQIHDGQHFALSAHRCMLKKDAKLRYGTYCPYEQQDYISIETHRGRHQMHVIDMSAHGHSVHYSVNVRELKVRT